MNKARSRWVHGGDTEKSFLVTWAHPPAMGDDSVQAMVPLVILEFLVIHASLGRGFLPVPALGVTETYGEGSGQWGEEPYRALATGAAYFAALGFVELYGGQGQGGKTPDPSSEAVVHAA
jgi:hypothetical protein